MTSKYKGFTLIELMIVIVILGILMATILPRLTGGQARARDAARVSDLRSISQALEAYYADNGVYPQTTAGANNRDCLSDTSDVGLQIAQYLKNNKIPVPPLGKQITASSVPSGCAPTTTAPIVPRYFYRPLSSKGINKNGYLLMSDVEIPQNANAIATEINNTTAPTVSGLSSPLQPSQVGPTQWFVETISPFIGARPVSDYALVDAAPNVGTDLAAWQTVYALVSGQ